MKTILATLNGLAMAACWEFARVCGSTPGFGGAGARLGSFAAACFERVARAGTLVGSVAPAGKPTLAFAWETRARRAVTQKPRPAVAVVLAFAALDPRKQSTNARRPTTPGTLTLSTDPVDGVSVDGASLESETRQKNASGWKPTSRWWRNGAWFSQAHIPTWVDRMHRCITVHLTF